MSISPNTVRTILRKFISDRLRVDEWGIGQPQAVRSDDRPPSKGRERPTIEFIKSEVASGYGQHAQVRVAERIELQVVFRLGEHYNYEDLTAPRSELEDRVAQITAEATANPSCVSDEFDELAVTSSVSLPQLQNGDWLPVARFNFVVAYFVTPASIVPSSSLFATTSTTIEALE